MRWRRAGYRAIIGLAVLGVLTAACAPARPAAEAPTQRPAASAPGGSGATGSGAAAPAQASPLQQALRMPLDELHQKALGEGGSLTYYGALAQINAEKIIPA